MLIKSIRWRLQLWQAFLLVCVLMGFGATAYQLQRIHLQNQTDRELDLRIAAVSADVHGMLPFGPPPGRPGFERGRDGLRMRPDGPDALPPGSKGEPHGPKDDMGGPGFGPRGHGLEPPDFAPPPELRLEGRTVRLDEKTLALFDQSSTNDFYFEIWSRTGRSLLRSTNAPAELKLPAKLTDVNVVHRADSRSHRQVFLQTPIGESILVGRDTATELRDLARFGWYLGLAGTGVLALGLGGGWLLATHAMRPVEAIGAAASRISAGNLSERINVADTESELGRLAEVLNSTFTRLETAFAQQRQFTADASHELRTPLAVIISEAQTTLARERNAAEYRETVETCLEAAQQMRRLTQSLLELARYDAGQEAVLHTPFDLAAQTQACVEMIRPLASQRGLRLLCDLAPCSTVGDADRLAQVVTNLLANAIHYNRDQGEIRVATRQQGNHAVLTVADTGQGIAPEDLPHIFERFYRADKARSRNHGRHGLGLAISKAIVDAHGGALEVASEAGAGSTFTLRLPGASPSPA